MTGRRQPIMQEDIRVHKGNRLSSQHRGVTVEAVRQRTLAKCSKGCCIHLHAHPDSSDIMPSTTRDMTTVSKIGPMISMGLLELRVPRQNPRVGSALSRANRARDKETQRKASSWRYPGPHRGNPVSSSFVSESWLGGFLHSPLCGLASSCPGSFDRNYQGTTRETTGPGFVRGASAPVWSYGEVLADASSHLPTVI
jgi:hypothetical protein